MKDLTHFLGTAIAVAGLCAAQGVTAAPLNLADGDRITLDWGSPSFGHAFGGGEFVAKGVGALSTKDSFLTFCVEFPEHISLSTAYYVKVNTGAVNGGYSNAPTYTGDTPGSTNFDPLSNASAWLYTQFRTNPTALNRPSDPWANNDAHANSLQLAFWKLENELSGSSLAAYNADARAQDWVAAAIGASWTNIHNVRVLNLYDTYNATTHVFSGNHQDQLYLAPVPEPETYAMLLAGLGLMGFVVRRRRQGKAA